MNFRNRNSLTSKNHLTSLNIIFKSNLNKKLNCYILILIIIFSSFNFNIINGNSFSKTEKKPQEGSFQPIKISKNDNNISHNQQQKNQKTNTTNPLLLFL